MNWIDIAQTIGLLIGVYKYMTVTESLQNFVAFHKETVDALIAEVNALPDKVAAILAQKGVPEDVVVATIQALSSDTQKVAVATELIPGAFPA